MANDHTAAAEGEIDRAGPPAEQWCVPGGTAKDRPGRCGAASQACETDNLNSAE